jgi:phage baseplate assembly protein W
MTTDFGSDLDCTDDLTAEMREVSGPIVLAQNIYRRLSTPRGMVIDAPDYGYDLRTLLHKGMTPTQIAEIPGIVRAEVTKDERVEGADVQVTAYVDDAMTLAIRCDTAEGPFSLTLDVTAAAVVLAEVR